MTQIEPVSGLETKVAGPQATSTEITGAVDDLMHAFDAFKAANDQRLNEIEKRMSADVVTTDKVERINVHLDEQKRMIDRLCLKAHRPLIGGGPEQRDSRAEEHKQAFDAYVRKGDASALRGIEAKSLSVGNDTDGGYLVPEETETEVGRLLTEASPLRAICGIRQISSSTYKKPFVTSGAATSWLNETSTRGTTTISPNLTELDFPVAELSAMPAATQRILDDAAINIDQWIAEEVQIAFAEKESDAFVNGNGTNKPRGFLDYNPVANSSWAWNKIGFVTSGASGAFASSDPSDALIDLVFALKSGYRQNAHWVMNMKTQGEIRKIKDADGNYIWQPAAQAGGAASLMNFPITESEDMPNISSNSFSIAFGNFRRGYLIVDRLGIRVLRDPYSTKPYVLFYTTKRVGGGVQNFEAIKLMKFSA